MLNDLILKIAILIIRDFVISTNTYMGYNLYTIQIYRVIEIYRPENYVCIHPSLNFRKKKLLMSNFDKEKKKKSFIESTVRGGDGGEKCFKK